jgi:hypothetical protein
MIQLALPAWLRQAALSALVAAASFGGGMGARPAQAQVSVAPTVPKAALSALEDQANLTATAQRIEAIAEELRRIRPFGEASASGRAISSGTGDAEPLALAQRVVALGEQLGATFDAEMEVAWKREAQALNVANLPAIVVQRHFALIDEVRAPRRVSSATEPAQSGQFGALGRCQRARAGQSGQLVCRARYRQRLSRDREPAVANAFRHRGQPTEDRRASGQNRQFAERWRQDPAGAR